MSEAVDPARVPRERFERHYAASEDPWGYRTREYEREKYAATLAALPQRALGRVLEVGCSIGVFTRMLAPRCERLIAVDFSTRALALAREELAGVANVELLQADFPAQAPSGEWDLVVCSEVLYYLDEPTLREAIDWLRLRLEHGASALTVSWRGRGVEEPFGGDELHDALARELSRWHALEQREDGYRLDRFDGAERAPGARLDGERA